LFSACLSGAGRLQFRRRPSGRFPTDGDLGRHSLQRSLSADHFLAAPFCQGSRATWTGLGGRLAGSSFSLSLALHDATARPRAPALALIILLPKRSLLSSGASDLFVIVQVCVNGLSAGPKGAPQLRSPRQAPAGRALFRLLAQQCIYGVL